MKQWIIVGLVLFVLVWYVGFRQASIISGIAPPVYEDEDVILELCNQPIGAEPGIMRLKVWVDGEVIGCYENTGCWAVNIGSRLAGEHTVTVCGGAISEGYYERIGDPCGPRWYTPEECVPEGELKESIFYVYSREGVPPTTIPGVTTTPTTVGVTTVQTTVQTTVPGVTTTISPGETTTTIPIIDGKDPIRAVIDRIVNWFKNLISKLR